MKIGVIPQRFQKSTMESLKISHSIGAEAVQLYSVTRQENLHDKTGIELREILDFCGDTGMEITGICGEVGGFGFRDPRENPRKLELTRRNLELAKKLGGKVVTSHIGVINFNVRAVQLEALGKIADYAAEFGVIFAIETGSDPSRTLAGLLDELNSPWIKVNIDPANLVMIQNENPVESVRTLGRYIVHTHAKDGKCLKSCDPEQIYAAFARGDIKELFAQNGKAFIETPIGSGLDWSGYLRELYHLDPTLPLIIEREISDTIVEDCKSAILFLKQRRADLQQNCSVCR